MADRPSLPRLTHDARSSPYLYPPLLIDHYSCFLSIYAHLLLCYAHPGVYPVRQGERFIPASLLHKLW